MSTPGCAARVLTWLTACVGVAASGGCSSTAKITSTGPDRPIVVDGRIDDWPPDRTLLKDERISVDVRNDANYLYLSLVTSNRAYIRSIMMGGLTVWFDAEGGRHRAFGIRYPLGISVEDRFSPREGDFGERSRPSDDRFKAAGEEIEIVGKDDYSARYHRDALPGIDARADVSYGTFTYEMQVPLHATDTMFEAIDADAGTVIGVGLETGHMMRRGEMGGPSGGGMGPGGMGGGMGGAGRRRGGMGGPGSGPEPLDEWIRVTLAKP